MCHILIEKKNTLFKTEREKNYGSQRDKYTPLSLDVEKNFHIRRGHEKNGPQTLCICPTVPFFMIASRNENEENWR